MMHVALLTEGVDRNMDELKIVYEDDVALLTEGVDRNSLCDTEKHERSSRPPHGGRG